MQKLWNRSLTAGLAAAIATVTSASAAWAVEPTAPAQPAVPDLAPNAKSAVLMDASTGTIFYEKNGNERLPLASITKVMTMILVMEALDEGKLRMDEKVRTSEYAASMGGSQIFLEPGEEMTVSELLKGVAMASGNDASVALAEKVAGSEQSFVQMMNAKAQALGLKNTRFQNPNGLPASDHYSSALDIAIMSRELLKHEEVTKFTGQYQDYLRKDTEKPFWLVNTNKLVRFYPGVDGLKTGYTREAMFCLTATAKRDNFRTVAVVMGEPDTKTRNAEVTKLFDYAFSQYESIPIFETGQEIGEVRVEKGKDSAFKLTAKHPYNIVVKKGEGKEDIRHELELTPLKAPVQQGQPIGKLKVYKGERLLIEYPLEAPNDIDRAGWWTLLKRTTKKLILVD